MNWFYSDNGQQRGPISDMELTNLVRQGTLPPSTLVWKEGMPDWQPLSQVRPDLTQVTAATPTLGGVPIYDKGALLQQMREGVITEAPSQGMMQYVGFWWRVLARFIDGILVGVVGCLFAMPVAMIFGVAAAGMDGGSSGASAGMQLVGQLVTQAIGFAVGAGYFTWMTGKYGATLGKLALGFKVVTADGGRITYGRAFGRWAADQLLGSLIMWIVVVIPVALVMVLGLGSMKGLSDMDPDTMAGGMVFGMVAAVFVGCLLGSFPWWMAAFDAEKRTLHDRICATRVIRK